jgi:AraC family transcriptional regulator
MEQVEVRIVELKPIHVASAHAFGPSPEGPAWEKITSWAEAQGLLGGDRQPRIFGFNNPSPAPGSPNYGYEFWIEVGPEVQGSDEIALKDFKGGLYAVMRCTAETGEDIPVCWQKLMKWTEQSPYRFATHQWLEQHIGYTGGPGIGLILDLYLPVTAAPVGK